jgi:23S rRNA-/tRNA-specific pseudouridylate synthase
MPHQWYTLEPTLEQVEQVVVMEDEEEDWNCTTTTNTTTTALSLPQYLDVSSLPRASELLWLYKPDGLLTLPGKTEPDSLATQVNEYLNLHRQHQEETQQEEIQYPLQNQALLEQQGQSNNSGNNHRQQGNSSKRQVDQQQQQQQRKPQQPAPWVPRPCHRLDRDTSGIVVMATTREAYTALSKQFEQRHVTKQYVALVQGCVETDVGVIDRPIGEKKMTTAPSPQQNGEEAGESSYKVWTTDPGADKARSAVTYYQVSRRYTTTAATSSYTRVILQPQTGRGHQLRLHMAEVLGHPILGDTLHGSNNQHEATSNSGRDNDNSHKSSSAFARMNPPRLCLHAEYLQVWVLDENNQVRQAKCWCLPPF